MKNNYNFHMLNLQILKLIKIHIFIFFVSIYWTSVLYKHNSDWQSYWYDLSVCSNGLFTLNEISGSDTTSDARQEAVASGHSGDNTDRGDRGAGDLEPAVKQWHEAPTYLHRPDMILNTEAANDPSVFTIMEKAPTRVFNNIIVYYVKALVGAFSVIVKTNGQWIVCSSNIYTDQTWCSIPWWWWQLVSIGCSVVLWPVVSLGKNTRPWYWELELETCFLCPHSIAV